MDILISVVICTYNRASYLAKAIQSLLEQSLEPQSYEIIIVDNGSTDTTKMTVEQFSANINIRYIYESNQGLCYARNTGWRKAKGKYVAYLDDDAIASPFWLNKIIEVFDSGIANPGCVGGKVKPIWEAPRPQWLSDELLATLTIVDWSDAPQVISDLSQQWLVGANIAFPKEVLEELGGFVAGLGRVGNNLLSGDDTFLEKQIIQAGYSCFYHPEIVVHHHIQLSRLSQDWFISRYLWQGRSDAMMQLIEATLPWYNRFWMVALKVVGLLRSPKKVLALLIPTDKPKQFTQKCFALIEIGHIFGLWKPEI
uniref:Glycosyl transferase family 2 n=1 Tax=Cyanothece sp. (strain PCC 7425 / ATCC 29141) TaxID=395961 RepID=B8HT95_CYAP4